MYLDTSNWLPAPLLSGIEQMNLVLFKYILGIFICCSGTSRLTFDVDKHGLSLLRLSLLALLKSRRRDIGISMPAIILGHIISEVHLEAIHQYVWPIPGSSIKHSHFTRPQWYDLGKTTLFIVFRNECFNFHSGHAHHLQSAKSHGAWLIIGTPMLQSNWNRPIVHNTQLVWLSTLAYSIDCYGVQVTFSSSLSSPRIYPAQFWGK